ncbi:hypothetical protein QBC46DRAFT_438377 [Diplogelasinospora grovesii]|uniref:Uncharacterized protein n=1 Tax=Diplogelasinospora grovesii TaxID=303347 RepID=A0AAN6N5H9_9PEZI|nr:hypothetical protein QBC46DRAFT_438377 [Diplogelasinospora grovesii]
MNRSHYLPHTAYTISPYPPRLGAPAYQPMPAAALPPAPFSQSPIAYPPTTYNQSMPVNMMQPSHSSNQWTTNVSPFGAAGYTPMAGQVEDIIGSPPPGSLAGTQSPPGMGTTTRMPMSMASMQALSMTTPLSMPMPMPVMHHPHPHPSSMPQVQDVFARPSQPQQQFTTTAPPSFHHHQQRQSFEQQRRQQQQQQQQLQQQYQQQQEQQQYNTHVGVNGAYPPLQTSMMQSSPGGRAGSSGNSPLGIIPPQRPLDPATVLARPRYEEYSPPPPPPPTQQQMQASNTPSAVFSSFMSP